MGSLLIVILTGMRWCIIVALFAFLIVSRWWASFICLLPSKRVSCPTQAQQLWRTGLVTPKHVEYSWTRDPAHGPCTVRWIIHHWAWPTPSNWPPLWRDSLAPQVPWGRGKMFWSLSHCSTAPLPNPFCFYSSQVLLGKYTVP